MFNVFRRHDAKVNVVCNNLTETHTLENLGKRITNSLAFSKTKVKMMLTDCDAEGKTVVIYS